MYLVKWQLAPIVVQVGKLSARQVEIAIFKLFRCKMSAPTLKILIATDNHCGYNEVKRRTYEDAFNTLEEVFEQAKFNEVDCVLLGSLNCL